MRKCIVVLLSLFVIGFSTSIWTERDFIAADSIPRGNAVMQHDAAVLRGEWQRWSYIHELCQTAAFVASMQVSDPMDPEFGGIIEGEDELGVVETDNTQQAIWVWCRYYQITGDTTYFLNISRAWIYVLNHPAWLEEGTDSDFYRVWNCGLALFAESMYRNTFGDASYRAYADTCIYYMFSHPLSFTGVGSYYERLHPKAQSLAAGMLYQYGKELGVQVWQDTACVYGERVASWIEANPDTNINDEVWAMSGGTAVWGLCRSIFDADTLAGTTWLNTYLPLMKYYQPTGTWNNSWNIWYGNAYNYAARITQNPTYVEYHHSHVDSLLVQDYDDDGGVPPTKGWTQYQDHTWVSNYMVFMGFEGLMDSIKNTDAGVSGIYATGPRPFILTGDTMEMSIRVANYGFQALENVNCALSGPHSGDTIIDLGIGDEDSVVLSGIWVPGDTGYFDFTAQTSYPGDERPSNDTFSTVFYVRPLRQLTGNISDTVNGNGVYAQLYFQFVDDTGTVYFDSTVSDSVSGDFSVFLIDSLYRAVVHTRIPYPELVIEDIYVTPDSISIVNAGTGPADLLVVNRDNEERYASFYTLFLDSLGVSYKVWAPASQGIFPMSRMSEFNANTIIWYTGRATVNTVTPVEQDSLVDFFNNGGKLLMTGQNIGEELSSTTFYTSWLHASLVNDSIPSSYCYPDTLDSLGHDLIKIFTGGGALNQYSRDVVASDGSSHEFLFYNTSLTDCAALWYCDPGLNYRVIYCGFGFEGVSRLPLHMSPKELLAEFLDWFDIVSVEEIALESPTALQFMIFPNPIHQRLHMAIGGALLGEIGTIDVYDIAGRHVKTVCQGELVDRLSWDLMDDAGRRVANGVYFVSLMTADGSDIRKFVVLQ
jgi:hypothetical protein